MSHPLPAATQTRSPFAYALPLLALLALLISRNPARFFHPTLWAEDGLIWFQEFYVKGLASLLVPHAGYLQTYPRLIAGLGRMLPLVWLPSWFMIAGAFMQMAPVALLLTRGSSAIPSAKARWALVLFYIAMPNSEELYLNLTDAQWHLALVAFLLIVLKPPRHSFARSIQYATLLLAGLTGPFVLFLIPIALWQVLKLPPGDRRHAAIQIAALALAAMTQVIFLLSTMHTDRAPVPLGASATRLVRILTDQIFLGGLIGRGSMIHWQKREIWQIGAVAWLCAPLAFVVLIAAFRRGPTIWRQFAVFGTLVLASCLLFPVGNSSEQQWLMMDIPGVGCRYFFFPILIWFSGILVLAGSGHSISKFAAWALLLLSLIGITTDWHYDPSPSNTAGLYHRAAKQFARAPAGTIIVLPEDPAGWTMTLAKR